MNIIDMVFAICSSIVGVYILAIRVTEWTRDSKLKRQMRTAGVSEEYIKETLKIVELGRSRARRAPRFNGLPDMDGISRRRKVQA